MKIVIRGNPVTKKNSWRIGKVGGKTVLLPSRAYTDYERISLLQIKPTDRMMINYPIKCQYDYYMSTARRVDLDNLIAGTNDLLQKAGVIKDDALIKAIAATKDIDRKNPRVEVTILDW